MEKIVKKVTVPKYIQVQSDDYKEVIIYKTSDDKEFASSKEAQNHEDELLYEKLPHVSYNIVSTGYSWHKANTQEELDALIRHTSSRFVSRNTEELKLGEWFTIVYDYNDNSYDTATYVPLNELAADIKELMELLNEKER
jgi:hypothetical protein